jgi:hypothetical protein
VLGVAVLGVGLAVGAWTLWDGADSQIPGTYVPEPGDHLAEEDVVEAGDLLDLPEASGSELAFPVHGHGPACQLALGRRPERSAIARMSDSGTVTSSIDTVCRAGFLADGRFFATDGFGDGDLRTVVFDPRDLAAEPLALPEDVGQPYLGASSAVVGVTDEPGRILVTVEAPDGLEGLDLLDVDTGERQRLLPPGTVVDEEGARIAAAHLRSGHLVVVTAEASAVGGEAIPWVGHRFQVPTQVWFGPIDGELRAIRQMAALPPTEVEPGRTLLPPRIIDGPDGPLVVWLETTHEVDGRWEVVVTAPDGSSRVVGHLPGRSEATTGDRELLLSIGRVWGHEGGSLDAADAQVLIAGTAAAAGDPDASQPIGLVLDLEEGAWYRLPEEASSAGFVTAPGD